MLCSIVLRKILLVSFTHLAASIILSLFVTVFLNLFSSYVANRLQEAEFSAKQLAIVAVSILCCPAS